MTAELVEGRRRGRADRDAHVAEAPAEAGPPAHASARVDLVPRSSRHVGATAPSNGDS
jgi:hypothetical protein